MNILLEVVNDLAHFVFVEMFGWRATGSGLSSGKNFFAVAAPTPLITPLRRSTELLPSRSQTEVIMGTVSVVAKTAHLFLEPVASFDGVLTDVPYGTMLNVYQAENRWYRTAYREHSGWILKDTVTADNIYPRFQLGRFYDSKNVETIKLRSLIHDEFNGGLIEAPLQDVEYVTYKLRQKAKLLPWSDARPRISGNWKQLLRGAPGVYIGILPKADSVMEVVGDDAQGFVSYVDTVLPDESITVSEVGFLQEGMYSNRTLPKEEWRESRPVFIAVA